MRECTSLNLNLGDQRFKIKIAENVRRLKSILISNIKEVLHIRINKLT